MNCIDVNISIVSDSHYRYDLKLFFIKVRVHTMSNIYFYNSLFYSHYSGSDLIVKRRKPSTLIKHTQLF